MSIADTSGFMDHSDVVDGAVFLAGDILRLRFPRLCPLNVIFGSFFQDMGGRRIE